MSAYKHALAVSLDDSQQRIELACSLLKRGESVVLLEGRLALRTDGDRILCEVIDPYSNGVQSAKRYEELVASGIALLRQSALSTQLPADRLQWLVVTDYGTGTKQLWPFQERT